MSPSTKIVSTFTAEAVLFDMDGTLTDSIGAVEAAWAAVALEIGKNAEEVIAATHGRRGIDNLRELKPWIGEDKINAEVEAFERSILAFADEYQLKKAKVDADAAEIDSRYTASSTNASRRSSASDSAPSSSDSSRRSSLFDTEDKVRVAVPLTAEALQQGLAKLEVIGEEKDEMAGVPDRSVIILPGVRKVIDSLPDGRYAVATSGATTYCHGCLNRVGIEIPQVCVTADDPRIKIGKPDPTVFRLAASDLGFAPENCVVFEDSPSGIKAGVAAGATVIAVCTSHPREKIDRLGAHFVVDTMEQVGISQLASGKLLFVINH